MNKENALARRRAVRLTVAGVGAALIVALAIFAAPEGGPSPGSDPAPSDKADAACGADVPEPAAPKQYEAPPEPALDPAVDYTAIVHTSCGDIAMDLLEDEARVTVNNFVFLAREGFFDGLIWHRVEQNSVLQTGDPNGQNGVPPDGPGYAIDEELPRSKDAYVYGVVGMANAGSPGTTGSQWFIVVHEEGPAGFPADFSIFGVVDESSYPTLQEIASQPTKGGNVAVEAVKPTVPIYIESIEIITG